MAPPERAQLPGAEPGEEPEQQHDAVAASSERARVGVATNAAIWVSVNQTGGRARWWRIRTSRPRRAAGSAGTRPVR